MNLNKQNTGLRIIHILNVIVDLFLLILIMLIIFIASYALWDSKQIYSQADSQQYEIYKPTIKNEDTSFEDASFNKLKAINPDVFAWLTIYDTHIDYPVVQGKDNLKYVYTNAMGNYAASGSIFLDASNQLNFSDFNSILYGHHMEKQAMFGEIGYFNNKEYFDKREYGNIYFNNKNHGLQFFAFLHVSAYDSSIFETSITGKEKKQQYLDNLFKKSTYTRNIDVNIDDHIVLLSTCSLETTNGRDILVAKITDDVIENTLAETEQNSKNNTLINKNNKMYFLIFILLIILIIIIIYYKKHKKSSTSN